MKRLWLAIELFFQRQVGDDDSSDLTEVWDRMARDIKGSIYTLVSIFELISLTSYLAIDTVNIFNGRLQSINNLGGIVGAVFAEWFLGSVGVMGYAIVAITLFFAYLSFSGVSVRDNFFKILGATLTAFIGAITCRLVFRESFPEWSLLQGGILGKFGGDWLLHYFNTSGAILIVGGSFVVTLILTTGVSIANSIQSMWERDKNDEDFADEDEEDDEDFDEEEDGEELEEEQLEATRPKKAAKPKKKAKATSDEDSEEENSSDEESDEEESDSAPKVAGFQEMIPFRGKAVLPAPRLLKSSNGRAKKPSRGDLKRQSKQMAEHLLSFNVTGEITHVSIGPVLTTYEYKPSAGIKLKAIESLEDDLGVVMGTNQLRIIAPIPGKTVVGIEVPREEAEVIPLKELVAHNDFYSKKNKLPVALGKATDGTIEIGDLAAMPHLLVAGGTGSGKSVFINCLIAGLLYRLPPSQLRLILIDPKMLELVAFAGIPHLISDVVTNNHHAVHALDWAVEEMERRYSMMATTGSKNIDSYNAKANGAKKLPFIVIVVDELADLMMTAGEQVEISITRLAQKARAAGIHLVIATQRPSTDVITGVIKANLPSRLSFKVPSGIDSRTVLDAGGAQSLLGRGDSLMVRPAKPLQRIHGCYVDEDELKRVVNYVKDRKKHESLYLDFTQPVNPPPAPKKRNRKG